jgi:hypothetical protein
MTAARGGLALLRAALDIRWRTLPPNPAFHPLPSQQDAYRL